MGNWLRRHVPTRAWFRDDDGTYFRNCPLILAEQKRELDRTPPPWGWRHHFAILDALKAEWQHAWSEGVLRKDELEPGDVVVPMASFRDAYPDKPELWILDRRA